VGIDVMNQPSRRHVAKGIEAVIDSAHHAKGSNFDDVWVTPDDLADAVDTAKKLTDEREIEVRPSDRGNMHAIRLRL
jgi:hypothetical protein